MANWIRRRSSSPTSTRCGSPTRSGASGVTPPSWGGHADRWRPRRRPVLGRRRERPAAAARAVRLGRQRRPLDVVPRHRRGHRPPRRTLSTTIHATPDDGLLDAGDLEDLRDHGLGPAGGPAGRHGAVPGARVDVTTARRSISHVCSDGLFSLQSRSAWSARSVRATRVHHGEAGNGRGVHPFRSLPAGRVGSG